MPRCAEAAAAAAGLLGLVKGLPASARARRMRLGVAEGEPALLLLAAAEARPGLALLPAARL
jgi:hypothetical protein